MINGSRQTWYLGQSINANVTSNYFITQVDKFFNGNITNNIPISETFAFSVNPSNGNTYSGGYGSGNIFLDNYEATVIQTNAKGYYSSAIWSNIEINTSSYAPTRVIDLASTKGGLLYLSATGNNAGGGNPGGTNSELFRMGSAMEVVWQQDLPSVSFVSMNPLPSNGVSWAGGNYTLTYPSSQFGVFDFTGSSVFCNQVTLNVSNTSLSAPVIDSANNYILTGGAFISGVNRGFIMKTDSSGNLLWQKYVNLQFISAPVVDLSNNIYVTAEMYTTNLSLIQKYDSSGVLLWEKSIDVSGYDTGVYSSLLAYPAGLALDTTGNIYACGLLEGLTIASPPGYNEWGLLMKFDSSGNVIYSNALNFYPDLGNTQPISISVDNVQLYGNAMMTGWDVQKRFVPSDYEKSSYVMSFPINGSLTNVYTVGDSVFSYENWSNISTTSGSFTSVTSANLTVTPFSRSITSQSSTWSSLSPITDTVFLGNTQGPPPTPPVPISIDYLSVAGGGGGGDRVAGGGGAGGYLTGTYSTVSSGTVISVTVGGGGAGGVTDGGVGSNGTDSSISGSGLTTVTTVGGGRGGAVYGVSYGYPGNGGSGGGGSDGENGMSPAGGTGTSGQGYNGGSGYNPAPYCGGGGGGAGVAGGAATSSGPGTGGDGLASSITGASTYYAGGGSGGAWTGSGSLSPSAAGLGGGGQGEVAVGSDPIYGGAAGTVNTGGGGGGGAFSLYGSVIGSPGGNGGSGVGILRLLTSQYTGTVTGSPTVTTDGSYTVIKFTSSGTYTT